MSTEIMRGSSSLIPLAGDQASKHAVDLDRDLIKEIAMDIGKEVVAYIEVMYPKAVEATSSTFKLSVRNTVYNEIIAALEVNDADVIQERLRDRKAFRRRWTKQYRDLRNGDLEIIKRNLDQSFGIQALEEGSPKQEKQTGERENRFK